MWLLLQPRDLVNSHQLFVGRRALRQALLCVASSTRQPCAPAQRRPSIFPLFVTVACGAISGFHGSSSRAARRANEALGTSRAYGRLRRDARRRRARARQHRSRRSRASRWSARARCPAGAIADLMGDLLRSLGARGREQASAFDARGGAFLRAARHPTGARTVMAVLVI
ncbi:MAG: hypothetical protein H6721_32510 [Sandaracinus sp.]|nr:hypothetical protein [Sandaracinus sp.]